MVFVAEILMWLFLFPAYFSVHSVEAYIFCYLKVMKTVYSQALPLIDAEDLILTRGERYNISV